MLSCLSTLFKSMKLSLGEKDGGSQAGKEKRHFLSTLTQGDVIAAEAGIHLPSLQEWSRERAGIITPISLQAGAVGASQEDSCDPD